MNQSPSSCYGQLRLITVFTSLPLTVNVRASQAPTSNVELYLTLPKWTGYESRVQSMPWHLLLLVEWSLQHWVENRAESTPNAWGRIWKTGWTETCLFSTQEGNTLNWRKRSTTTIKTTTTTFYHIRGVSPGIEIPLSYVIWCWNQNFES